MGDPDDKARRARRRKRNIIAKEMFRQKKTEKIHDTYARRNDEYKAKRKMFDDETFDTD